MQILSPKCSTHFNPDNLLSDSAMRILLVLLFVTGAVLGAREEDRVDFLPGLDEDEQPDFNHYAGYLTATGGSKLFYW